MRENMKLGFKISVDGGIDETTSVRAKAFGADILVIGSTFFSNKDKKSLINSIIK
jgi:pentose-5-phosphate-3-epimerase